MADENAVPQEQPIPEDFREFKAFREGKAPEPAQQAVAAESAPAEEAKVQSENAGEQDAPKQGQEQDRDEHGRFKPKGTLTPEAQHAFDKRVGELVQERDRERQRADEAERRLAERTAGEPAKTPEPADTGEPKLEDFESIPAYLDARDKWRDAKAADETAKKQQNERVQSFIGAGQKLAEDFTSIAGEVGRKVSPDVATAIVESGEPKLVTYLHEHQDELARIGSMSGMAAAIEIGALKARINQPAPEKKEPAVSKAPKPAAPVGATAAPVKPNLYDENLPYDRFKAEREAQLSARH